MPPPEFETMREIGGPLDLTSHQVGRILTSAGWRTADGSPTAEAIEQGLVTTYRLENGGYAWKWKTVFVQQVLAAAKAARALLEGKDKRR